MSPLELTTTRHNPLIDPQLAVWSWEIPVYLFLGGVVDRLMLTVHPVVGVGRRLFDDSVPVTRLELLEATKTSVGNVLLTYALRPAD